MTLPDTFRPKLKALLLSNVRRLASGERGQALVETAISFFLLAMVTFGLIQVSWAAYSYHFLANAAHEGTRYAIVRGAGWYPVNCSGYNSSMCTASAAEIANFVASRNFPGINVTASDVCVEYFLSVPSSPSSTCTPNSGTVPNAPGDIVQVTITYPFTLNIPGMPLTVMTMSSTSQMVIAQ